MYSSIYWLQPFLSCITPFCCKAAPLIMLSFNSDVQLFLLLAPVFSWMGIILSVSVFSDGHASEGKELADDNL